MIFQEPILNIDRDGARIIVENIDELRANGTSLAANVATILGSAGIQSQELRRFISNLL